MAIRKKADPATDSRDASGAALRLWALGWDRSLLPIAKFIECVESAKPPPAKVMSRLATALRVFFCHRDTDASLMAFARRLGLPRQQGKRAKTYAESHHIEEAGLAIATRELELIETGMNRARARSQSIREYAAAHHKPLRTVQTWYSAKREFALSAAKLMSIHAAKSRG